MGAAPAVDHDLDRDAIFEAERPRLLGIVYRMTGSYADAEDAVQDAWLRWRNVRAAREPIERPAAWLTTVVSRIALDRLRSAHSRREAYVGPWLPEPVHTASLGCASSRCASAGCSSGSPGSAPDPSELAVLADSLRLGFLVLLDRLEPIERVVLLLADVFAVPFAEIATTVDKSPEACRQIASRARRQLRADGPTPKPTSAATRSVVEQFLESLLGGDIARMISLSADDVVLTSDGGPNHRAARRPVLGPDRVARFLRNIAARRGYWELEATTLNGDPAVVIRSFDRTTAAMVFEADDRVVRRVLIIVNPDKLVGLDAIVR